MQGRARGTFRRLNAQETSCPLREQRGGSASGQALPWREARTLQRQRFMKIASVALLACLACSSVACAAGTDDVSDTPLDTQSSSAEATNTVVTNGTRRAFTAPTVDDKIADKINRIYGRPSDDQRIDQNLVRSVDEPNVVAIQRQFRVGDFPNRTNGGNLGVEVNKPVTLPDDGN